jgi:ADP-ribose pyrophosphatase
MKLFQFSQNDVKIINKNVVYRGFFSIDEYTLTHKKYQGGECKITREIFERGDAVVLMPYDPKLDAVVFIEQFRAGAMNREYSPWLLEFVAGMIEPNESTLDVAIREAKEEANLTISPEQTQFIMEYLSSPGGTTEKIHLYWAEVDSTQANGIFGLPEEGEDILVHVLPRVEALALLAEGKINNAATVIALQWLAINAPLLRK